MSHYQVIAKALYTFLEDELSGNGQRRFLRLNGFEEEVYKALLDRIRRSENKIGGRDVVVRTTAPIEGYEEYALEEGKSATWYRNHVPAGYALILIFNEYTSDAQSLKDIYSVDDNVLATEGIDHLIRAAFTDYRLSPEELDILKKFLERVDPQLRYLVDFLIALNEYLRDHPGATIAKAIAENLPYLGLFRCRELSEHINTKKGDRLLRAIVEASLLGRELLDERTRNQYEERLEKIHFSDESPYGGLSPEEKRRLLKRFLQEVITDRSELLGVLQIDWKEVSQVLAKSRKSSKEKIKELGSKLEAAFKEQKIEEEELPDSVQEVLENLREGNEPDKEGLSFLLAEYGGLLPRRVRKRLQRLLMGDEHKTSDFIAGVMRLAVDLLSPLQEELSEGASLVVRFNDRSVDRITAKEREAIAAFRMLYGGIEHRMPHVQWDLDELWSLAIEHPIEVGEGEEGEDEGEDQERDIRAELPFDVMVVTGEGEDEESHAHARLIWQYHSEGPNGATFGHLCAEQIRLLERGNGTLPIPIYNTCPPVSHIGDIDLGRPIASLGAWYRDFTDLGERLRREMSHRARPETREAMEFVLCQLEKAWAGFIGKTIAAREDTIKEISSRGILSKQLDDFLSTYDKLLRTAIKYLKDEWEVISGHPLLTQAWMVGEETFEDWAVMPALHPVKLFWYKARVGAFDGFIARLLGKEPALIVDETRFKREFESVYSSAGYPAVLALPGKDRPEYFLPVYELNGYELFCKPAEATVTFGQEPTLTSDTDDEAAARVTARELARVIQDYLETYPFVRDGLEVYLVQCRNGALPGLLVEEIHRLRCCKGRDINLQVVVHSTDWGAPLYRRVIEWLHAHEEFAVRPARGYFQPVSLRVLECSYEELFRRLKNTDLVILPDVLSEKGLTVEGDIPEDVIPSHTEELPLRALQSPFKQGKASKTIDLTPFPQPALFAHFYAVQWAAREMKPVPEGKHIVFRQCISLIKWEKELSELHKHFNWVVCYDRAADRFLMEETFKNAVQVIRYSIGLGVRGQHNLTVSSSRRVREIVERRLTGSLETLLPLVEEPERYRIAQRLVEEARHISGDIVLRAAGPGAYLNELLGLVIAKYQTERRYLENHPGALTAWVYLDDFAHWFTGRMPDLLFVAIPGKVDDKMPLYMEVIEAKCVGGQNFIVEARDAEHQVAQGISRLAQAWAPGKKHLDAPFWYEQLYRAVAANLRVKREHRDLWKKFRMHLLEGDFELEMSGHAWVFCYDDVSCIPTPEENGEAEVSAPDARNIPCYRHHVRQDRLRSYLFEMIQEREDEERKPPAEAVPEEHAHKVDASSAPAEKPYSAVKSHAESTSRIPDSRSATSGLEPAVDSERVDVEEIDVVEEEKRQEEEESSLSRWVREKAQQLTRVLRNYDIEVYPVDPDDADIGPSVVQFKVRLRPGEKLNHLQSIAADIQRELALTTIPFIDNVRGTQYVGIDLPRPEPETLLLMEALKELPPAEVGHLPFLVGKTPSGETVIADLATLPHLLVAGSTGSGKTVFLYTLIVSLLHQFGPEALSLLLIDPKQTDFVYFEGLPHLMGGKVIIDAEEAISWLERLTTEVLNERTQMLRQARCRDIFDYNSRHPHTPIPPIVVVIDEYADLMQVLDRNRRQAFEQQLIRLAQRARNVGIHLVIATQRPSADIVTPSLKANLPARIAFRLPSHHDSMTILDRPGAENLLGRGDMLFLRDGQVERLQGFYISPEELNQFIELLA